MNNIEIDWLVSQITYIGICVNEILNLINDAKRKDGKPIIIDHSSYGNEGDFIKSIRELIPILNRMSNKITTVNKK